ncbi:exosome complex protein Rrp42 [Aeropyrum camini]|uniref:Exosome complex component Rrp42 n=1 Tax=Aeropyrum camini SY1 = JCM 12091 TaxID=1198449 RepID=U3TEJ0_9CREN|nr:exosome complex protein Rrp42 [Aeropyrum camini]BAN90378.1 exosome complex RNA-binding protein Rrp42 [Aeropyrum camini SY1 = JCM 12091]
MSITPHRLPVAPVIVREAYLSLLRKGWRLEDRDLKTPRNVKIETGIVEKAEGSALVKLGKTQVIAGVKASVGAPFRDTPNQGVLTVHAEFVPLASPVFEPGPPDENAIELARVVDRSLREVGAIDLESLVIRPGEKVWVLWVDLYIIDHDGNLFDASMLATMAALMTARLPKYEESETGDIVIKKGEKGEKVKVKTRVVTVTTAKIDRYIVVDPSLEEETVSDVRLATAIDGEGRIVGMQKTGMGSLTEADIETMVNYSLEASKVYFKALEEAIKP